MFTAENFRRVFDTENRKGLDLVGLYFPHLDPKTISVRDKISEIRTLRTRQSTFPAETYAAHHAELKTELAALKAEKSAAIELEMENLSVKVAQPHFKLTLEKKIGPLSKPVFCIDGSPETFFVIKQLQRNIHRIYNVKQANRHDLACRVRDTIKSGFPFELVRTDISSFYESIDRKKLFSKLDNDQLLSSSSKRFIKQILDSYGALSAATQGIPRGVGISAYLAELFLRPVDRGIASIPGIVLYCRYVDDIVAIFARPPSGGALGAYKDLVIKTLSDNGLTHNATKTEEIDFGVKAGVKTFEYLGYRFTATGGDLKIAPSDAKVKKLELRLEAAFSEYDDMVSKDSRRAFRNVVARVKFLTGNARLLNSKSSATTGIYYNNPIVTDLSQLERLDTILKSRIRGIKRPNLRKKLLAYKFTEGFLQRRFHNFSSRELQVIVRVWKHVQA